MKKSLSLFLCLALILTLSVAFTGCNSSEKILVVWSFTDELETMVKDYYLKDNDGLDYKVSVHLYPTEVYQTKLDGAFMTGRNLPDVIALEIAYVKKYVNSGFLYSLSSDGLNLEADAKEVSYPYTLDVATNNEKLYGLSWQATPGAFYYRRSMAEQVLGSSDPLIVQEFLSDWGKFMETAEQLKQNGDIRIMSSLTGALRVFLAQREKAWIDNNKLEIDEYMMEYFDHAKQLQQNLYINETQEYREGWFSDMSKDKVFGYFLSTWGLHYSLKPNAKDASGTSDTSGDWGVIPGPAPYFYGGTWLAVHKDSKMKDEAKALIEYFTLNEDFLTKWASDTGDFVNNRNVVNSIKDGFNDEFLSGQNHYSLFASLADNVRANNLSGFDSSINNVFLESVVNYALGEIATKQTAIAQFKDVIRFTYPNVTVN